MLGLVSFAPQRVAAVPATARLHLMTQPDGTTFQFRLRGDEWFHWHETPDGHPLAIDMKTHYWVYALPGGVGVALRSTAIVGQQPPPIAPWQPVPPALPKRASMNARRLARRQSVARSMTGMSGVANIPVILINFPDRSAAYSPFDFYTLLFNSSHSMANLYREMSRGKFTVSPGPDGIVGWYTAAHPHDYYGADLGSNGSAAKTDGSSSDAHPGELVAEAVDAADAAGFDFAPYDQNGDGAVDTVEVIHEGTDQAESGISTDIWSHEGTLSDDQYYNGDGPGVIATRAGVFVNKYIILPELSASGLATVGTFCHEYGHVLGLPDLYDVDYSSEGLGAWSLMAYGGNNGIATPGDTPAHMDAWCKMQLGWVTPLVPTANKFGARIPAAENASFAYKLWSNGAPNNEYYLVENRQQTGFDAALPGAGLLIYHVDDAKSSDTNQDNTQEWYPGHSRSGHYHVALAQADGLYDLEQSAPRAAAENLGDAGDPYPGSTRNRNFADLTSPGSRSYVGAKTNVGVVNISDSAPVMTADVLVTLVFPPNDDFAKAQTLNGSSGRVMGTNVNATREAGEPAYKGNGKADGGKSVWYRYTAPAGGRLILTTAGSKFNTLLSVYTGTVVNALTSVGSNDDAAGRTDGASVVALSVTGGKTYYIKIDGLNGATGILSLASTFIYGVPANDKFDHAQTLNGPSGHVTGYNFNATKEAGEPNHANNPGGRSVWYRWTAPADGTFGIRTSGSDFDTLLAVYTGNTVASLTLVDNGSNNDEASQVVTSAVSIVVQAGKVYNIAVDGNNATTTINGTASGSILLTWNFTPSNPSGQLRASALAASTTSHSALTVSVATANAATSSLQLRFSQASVGESAGDAAHYSVWVNGHAVTVEAAGYNATSHTVALSLAPGTLHAGDQVLARWNALPTAGGVLRSGQAIVVVGYR